MFEAELFRKQIYCIEESSCDIVGTFRRPGNFTPLVMPLMSRSSRKYRRCHKWLTTLALKAKKDFGNQQKLFFETLWFLVRLGFFKINNS